MMPNPLAFHHGPLEYPSYYGLPPMDGSANTSAGQKASHGTEECVQTVTEMRPVMLEAQHPSGCWECKI